MNFVGSDFVNLLTIKTNCKTRRFDQTSVICKWAIRISPWIYICVSSLTAYFKKCFLFKNWDLLIMCGQTQFVQRFVIRFWIFILNYFSSFYVSIRFLSVYTSKIFSSPRKQRHIRDIDCAADGKFESWLVKWA